MASTAGRLEGAAAGTSGLGDDGFYWKTEAWRDERQFRPQRYVDWIAPGELLNAGMRAVVSKTFGDYSDRRDLMGSRPLRTRAVADGIDGNGSFDRRRDLARSQTTGDHNEYWFDYVADVGDGFDATFAVAQQLAANRLAPDRLRAVGHFDPGEFTGVRELPRGRLLVMGGDEVYPVAKSEPDRNSYYDRTAAPYEVALQYRYARVGHEDEPVLHLYAIPGNHDWYDGLAAFTKQFCTGQWIGAWKTEQHGSYFAVRLPLGWSIWGIDIAFEGPMDRPQLEYFKDAGLHLGDEEGVILCTAKPSWIDCATNSEDRDRAYTLLRWFMDEAIPEGKRGVRLMLSGDKHYYARYSGAQLPNGTHAGITKIIAGGGGASLSLTHDLPNEIEVREMQTVDWSLYSLKGHCWPDRFRSAAKVPVSLFRRLVGVHLVTKDRPAVGFSLFVAAFYLLFAYVMRLAVDDRATRNVARDFHLQHPNHLPPKVGIGRVIHYVANDGWSRAFGRLLRETTHYAPFWLLAALVLAGMIVLARKEGERLPFNRLWGAGHAFGHLALILLITTFAMYIADDMSISSSIPVIGQPHGVVFVGIVLALGFVVGTVAFVAYLELASLRRRNLRELAAALSDPDWKNFLRVHVTKDALTIYALGLRHVPRGRKLRFEDGVARFEKPQVAWSLIDRVVVPRMPTSPT